MDLVSGLLTDGVLEPVQARLIRQRQGALGGALADHLLEMGLLSYDDLATAMSRWTGHASIGGIELDLADRATRRFLSPKLAQRYQTVPICLIGRRLVLATSAPEKAQDLFPSLRSAHQIHPELRIAAPFLVESLLGWLYGLPASEMAQTLCARLTPRFYRVPGPQAPLQGKAPVQTLEPQAKAVQATGLGDLMERLRKTQNARDWLIELRESLGSWSPPVEVSRNRQRGLRESAFLVPLPTSERPLFWLSCQGEGRRLDRVRRQRLESLAVLLKPEISRVMGSRKS